jgi:hypothetical protein
VILAGSAVRDGPFFRSHCITMRAPDYWPICGQPREWVSIGSGSTHKTAKHFANLTPDSEWPYLQSEVVTPGEVARSVATTVVLDLMKSPIVSVSGVVHEESSTGAAILAGVDVSLARFLRVGGEFRYRAVNGVLGIGGVSTGFGEDQLGEFAAALRVSFGL